MDLSRQRNGLMEIENFASSRWRKRPYRGRENGPIEIEKTALST